MDRTSVARRIQLGAVRILQTKIAEASDGIMAKPLVQVADVVPSLTEMGRFIWITQRNHSSLQIQAARLAHIPL
eukprot:COSAG02_NODE_67519_length_252_cov_4.620915_1_plen_74_part_01